VEQLAYKILNNCKFWGINL